MNEKWTTKKLKIMFKELKKLIMALALIWKFLSFQKVGKSHDIILFNKKSFDKLKETV